MENINKLSGSKETVIGVSGRRISVTASKLNPDMVTLTVTGNDRQHLCSITLTPDGAAVFGDALNAVAGRVSMVTVPVREPANWFDVNQAARGAA